MEFPAQALRAPADCPLKTLQTTLFSLLARVFRVQRSCQHPCPSFPIAGQQNCPVCGAWRDYIFSPHWQDEYNQLLTEYKHGYLSRESFAAEAH